MTRMTPTVLVMALLVLFMLAGVLPADGGKQAVVFHTPVFIALLGLLALLLAHCSWNGGWGWRRAGFLLTHLGVVAILAGALTGWIAGESHEFILPVRPGRFWNKVPMPGGRTIAFPFALACNSFSVEYYDPSYDVYQPVIRDGKTEYRKVSTHMLAATGELVLGKYGRLNRADLYAAESQTWHEEHSLTNGWVLRLRPPVPRLYRAELSLRLDGETVLDRVLMVNHPVVLRGWRIYLVSYEPQRMPHVVLKGRRDPGRGAVVAGIWMVMVGTLLLGARAWMREGERHEGD